MSFQLEELHRQVGLQLATHVWTTTVASFQLIPAPGASRKTVIHYIACHQSAAAGLVHLAYTTTAGTTVWKYNATGPFAEEAFIALDANQPAELHMAATGGAGFIRAYYSTRLASGTTE